VNCWLLLFIYLLFDLPLSGRKAPSLMSFRFVMFLHDSVTLISTLMMMIIIIIIIIISLLSKELGRLRGTVGLRRILKVLTCLERMQMEMERSQVSNQVHLENVCYNGACRTMCTHTHTHVCVYYIILYSDMEYNFLGPMETFGGPCLACGKQFTE